MTIKDFYEHKDPSNFKCVTMDECHEMASKSFYGFNYKLKIQGPWIFNPERVCFFGVSGTISDSVYKFYKRNIGKTKIYPFLKEFEYLSEKCT